MPLLSDVLAWVDDNRGRSLCYLVIFLLLVVPVVLHAFGAFSGPVPTVRPLVCSRALC